FTVNTADHLGLQEAIQAGFLDNLMDMANQLQQKTVCGNNLFDLVDDVRIGEPAAGDSAYIAEALQSLVR
ncbi:hypothetical protein LCGC14_2436560, partial [marine sediment metagenome]